MPWKDNNEADARRTQQLPATAQPQQTRLAESDGLQSAMQPLQQEQPGLPAEFVERRKKLKRKKRIRLGVAGAVVLVAVIAGAVTLLGGGGQKMPERVSAGTYTEEVTRGDLDLTVEGSGTLAAASTSDVSSEISGKVTKVYVEVGDAVTAGQTLLTLTSEDLQDQIDAAYSQKTSAYSSYKEAKSSYSRAYSDYTSAKKAYDKAKKNASKSSSQVEAPAAGVVDEAQAQPGAQGQSGSQTGTTTTAAAAGGTDAVTQAQQAL
ncbi:MAG: biotin/lipoyl-binding protein, partial [Coriobacteriia bacterium]|nr:biotin/lipoyl-binding protein [Coriobacteriia bacterium]